MMAKEKTILIQELKKAWYTSKEIQKVLRWLNDVDKKNTLSPEEVYRNLLAKQKVYV